MLETIMLAAGSRMKAEFTARNQPPNFDVQNEISFYHPIIWCVSAAGRNIGI